MKGRAGIGLEAAADLDAVELRHHHVEEDQVRASCSWPLASASSPSAASTAHSPASRAASRGCRDYLVVIDDQDARRVMHGDLAQTDGYGTVHYGRIFADFRQQGARAVGLGHIGVAARRAGLVLVAAQRIRGDGDDRNIA